MLRRTTQAPCEVACSGYAQVSVVTKERGRDDGIPVTGHNVFIDIDARGSDVTLEAIRATVRARGLLDVQGVTVVPNPRNPYAATDPARAAEARRAAQSYQPIQPADLDVLLDSNPPMLRETSGRRTQLPLRIPPGTRARVVLVPHTEEPRLVHWQLAADVTADGIRRTHSWNWSCTAETTFATHYPDGSRRRTPAHEFTEHQPPPADASGPPPASPGQPPVHGGPSGVATRIADLPVRDFAEPAEELTKAVRVKTVPIIKGSWSMDIVRCTLAGHAAWAYVSNGLRQHGQREVLTFIADRAEAGPLTFPFDHSVAIGGMARRGQRHEANFVGVISGPLTEVIRAEDPRITGFAYLGYRFPQIASVMEAVGRAGEFPLVVLPLIGDETRTAGSYGLVRHLTARQLPFIHDPERHELPAAATELRDAFNVTSLTTRIADGTLHIRVPAGEAPLLATALRDRPLPATLLTGLPLGVSGLLGWEHGRQVVFGDASSVGLNHLTVGVRPRGHGLPSSCSLREDGVSLTFAEHDWGPLLADLAAGRDHTLRILGAVHEVRLTMVTP